MSKYLFIGGVADGEWKEVTQKQIDEGVVRAIRSIPYFDPYSPIYSIHELNATVKYDEYTPRSFYVEGEEIVIFVERNMTAKNMFFRLLNGYRYE